MKTVVLGKKIENTYDIDTKQKEIKMPNGEVKMVFTDKPVITKDSKIVSWSELCSFEGEPRYNRSHQLLISFTFVGSLNISEDEEVHIAKEIFRADLNELHLQTDKIMEEINPGKQIVENEYEVYLGTFNEMMIESNEKMKSYCDLHKLGYKDTDCIKLFQLLYPNEMYEIVDGVMRVKTESDALGDILAVKGISAYATTASSSHTHCAF